MVLAHIAGLPIEETALSLAPVIATGGGIATLRLRERLAGRRARRAQPGLRDSCVPPVRPPRGRIFS